MGRAVRAQWEIRRMGEDDCPEAARFVAKTMTWTWRSFGQRAVTRRAVGKWIRLRQRSLAPGLKDPDQFCFLALGGGQILGLVLGQSGFGIGTVDWLAVDPAHQGKGIGKALLAAAERHMRRKGCHKMTLYTYTVLAPAISLYLKSGMIPEAFLRQHALGEDYLVMSKWLAGPRTRGRKAGA